MLLHAAAGGVGLIVSQWAKLLGLTVIGTVSTEDKAEGGVEEEAAPKKKTATRRTQGRC